MLSGPCSEERQCQNLVKDFGERFRLKGNLKGRGKNKTKHIRRPQSLLWKTLDGGNRSPSEGAVAQPLAGGSRL